MKNVSAELQSRNEDVGISVLLSLFSEAEIKPSESKIYYFLLWTNHRAGQLFWRWYTAPTKCYYLIKGVSWLEQKNTF